VGPRQRWGQAQGEKRVSGQGRGSKVAGAGKCTGVPSSLNPHMGPGRPGPAQGLDPAWHPRLRATGFAPFDPLPLFPRLWPCVLMPASAVMPRAPILLSLFSLGFPSVLYFPPIFDPVPLCPAPVACGAQAERGDAARGAGPAGADPEAGGHSLLQHRDAESQGRPESRLLCGAPRTIPWRAEEGGARPPKAPRACASWPAFALSLWPAGQSFCWRCTSACAGEC